MKPIVSIVLMSVVTYLIRVTPITVFRKEIKSQFVKSFLYYVPYAVLSAMAFPAIFYSTGNTLSAIVGTVVALVLAFLEKGLMTVAVFSVLSAFLISLI